VKGDDDSDNIFNAPLPPTQPPLVMMAQAMTVTSMIPLLTATATTVSWSTIPFMVPQRRVPL